MLTSTRLSMKWRWSRPGKLQTWEAQFSTLGLSRSWVICCLDAQEDKTTATIITSALTNLTRRKLPGKTILKLFTIKDIILYLKTLFQKTFFQCSKIGALFMDPSLIVMSTICCLLSDTGNFKGSISGHFQRWCQWKCEKNFHSHKIYVKLYFMPIFDGWFQTSLEICLKKLLHVYISIFNIKQYAVHLSFMLHFLRKIPALTASDTKL